MGERAKQVVSVVFAIALAGWTVLTVLQQTTKGKQIVARVDPSGAFVPIWTFFAPRPATTDLEFLYRDSLGGGELTPWQVIQFFEERRLLHAVFHSNRRAEKTAFDIAQELKVLAFDKVPLDRLQLATPYLIALNFVVSHLPHPAGATHTQFMLATNPGYEIDGEEPTLVFASDFHRLDS